MHKKHHLTFYVICLCALVIHLSCGKKSDESSSSKESSQVKSIQTQAVSKTVDPSQTGTLKGKVLFKGEAPQREALPVEGNPECKAFHPEPILSEELLTKDGALQNVFVYIKEGLENYSFQTPETSVKIDQSKCMYVPHVTGAQINQPILLVNSDPTLHNIHSYAKKNETWNLGMPFEGMEITKSFANAEVMITFKCDVHPWMKGYLGVLPHPFFSTTGADGLFEMKNLPPGKYKIEAWHEKLETQTQDVEVHPQETKELEFTFTL